MIHCYTKHNRIYIYSARLLAVRSRGLERGEGRECVRIPEKQGLAPCKLCANIIWLNQGGVSADNEIVDVKR